MLGALLNILTFVLILVSLFLVMIVLMQKSKDGGMGATLGGGAAEQAFGAETGNVLSKSTIVAAIAFFVLAFGLYLGRVYQHGAARRADQNALPALTSAPAAATTPAATPAAAPSVTTPAAATTTPATTTPAPEAKKQP